MLEWEPVFAEFLRALHKRKVRFLVVGAHALAVHGQPRNTGDFDLWVEPTPTNARRVVDALADFGYPAYRRHVRDFQKPEQMTHMGVPPMRIDVMTSISGVPSFRSAWSRAVVTRLGGLEARVLGRDDFLRNKVASGRPKDLVDVALLEEAEAGAAARRRTKRAPTRQNTGAARRKK